MGGVPVAMPATPRQGRPEIFAVDWPAARPPPLAPPCRSRPCRRGEYGWVFEARGAVTRAGVVSRVWGSWWAGRRGDQGAREEEWARRLRLLRGEGRRAGTRAGPAGMGRLARVRCCRPGGARGASRRPCAPPPPPPQPPPFARDSAPGPHQTMRDPRGRTRTRPPPRQSKNSANKRFCGRLEPAISNAQNASWRPASGGRAPRKLWSPARPAPVAPIARARASSLESRRARPLGSPCNAKGSGRRSADGPGEPRGGALYVACHSLPPARPASFPWAARGAAVSARP